MPIQYALVYLFLALAGIGRNFLDLPIDPGVVKTLPALMLTLCAAVYSRPRFGPWIILGIACGAVGDYSLANADRSWFLAGLAAFLIGHVAYSIAFAKDLRGTPARYVLIAGTLFAMLLLAVAVVLHMIFKGDTQFIAPLLLYIIVMGVMMTLAVLHQSNTWFIAAGAIIFILSDAHIAVNHMLLEKTNLAITLSGYTTYYAAQYLLVAGAIHEARASRKSPD